MGYGAAVLLVVVAFVEGRHPVVESEADLALAAVPPPLPLVRVKGGLPEAFSWRKVAGKLMCKVVATLTDVLSLNGYGSNARWRFIIVNVLVTS